MSYALKFRPGRVPFMAAAVVTLLGALWAGLVRIGWSLPAAQSAPLLTHGPLMVSGFLGTVIGLERAVALDRRPAFIAPLLTAAGGLALLLRPEAAAGAVLLTAGSVAFLAVMVAISRRQPGAPMLIMVLGAVSWLIGNAGLAAGQPIYSLVPWWAGFPVLTLVAERLELSGLMIKSRRRLLPVHVAVAVTLIAATIEAPVFAARALGTMTSAPIGARIGAAATLVMALWLLRFDTARLRVRAGGLAGYVAIAVMGGYAWLAVSAGVRLWFGALTQGFAYDAVQHSLFVGFVFSMIFAHAPIIFPAVLGIDIPFRRRFYLPLVILHTSLALRLAGDAARWTPWRQWGAMLNAVAIIAFFATVVSVAIGARLARQRAAT